MKPGTDYTRVYRMAFASVYPHYIAKAEKKGRTKAEVHTIIHWLTGYEDKALQKIIANKVDFETFFTQAPCMNPNVSKITGLICGYRLVARRRRRPNALSLSKKILVMHFDAPMISFRHGRVPRQSTNHSNRPGFDS